MLAKTVTIMSSKSYDKVNPVNATFPVAVGNKKSSHQEVELQFFQDLAKLRSGKSYFYNKAIGTNACVYLELIASLQDQPEHRASNCLMLGSGRSPPKASKTKSPPKASKAKSPPKASEDKSPPKVSKAKSPQPLKENPPPRASKAKSP